MAYVRVNFTNAHGQLVFYHVIKPRGRGWLQRWFVKRIYAAQRRIYSVSDGERDFTFAVVNPATGEKIDVVPTVQIVEGDPPR